MVSCKDCQYISVCREAKYYYKGDDIHSNYFCEDFKPKLIDKCSYCGGLINHPVYAWPYWNGNYPVCSSYCEKEFQKGAELNGSYSTEV